MGVQGDVAFTGRDRSVVAESVGFVKSLAISQRFSFTVVQCVVESFSFSFYVAICVS
jgi:hypothetical protein